MKNCFLGNNVANLMLENMGKFQKFAHGFLLCGENGLGKKTFAKKIILTAICSNLVDNKPCMHCSNCKKVLNDTHPDILTIHGGLIPNSIHIEEIRKIRVDCNVKPNEAKYKIYLITNAQNMSIGATNAFLKTLEEPPENTIFILTATSADDLMPTVVSRLNIINIYPISDEDVSTYLTENYEDIPSEQIKSAVSFACGNLGRAIQALTDEQTKGFAQDLLQLTSLIALKKEYDILKYFTTLEKDKLKFIKTLDFLINELHKILLCKEHVLTLQEVNVELCNSLTKKQVIDLLEFIQIAKQKLNTNANYNLMIAYISSKIRQIID